MQKNWINESNKKRNKLQQKCWIQKLVKDDNSNVTHRDEILEEATQHFEKIYTDPNKEEMEHLYGTNSVTAEVILEFTNDEIEYVTEDLKTEKAPGDDMIVNELIKVAKEILTTLPRQIIYTNTKTRHCTKAVGNKQSHTVT